jgi:hypothetical protein
MLCHHYNCGLGLSKQEALLKKRWRLPQDLL